MVIIFNPVAGRRRANLLWRVLDVLAANGVRLELAETRWRGHAECLARDAVARGEPIVVAAGGDGTIAEVANGLIGSKVRLGVIPLGTANVLAHELGLPFTPRAVAAALAFGRTSQLWPGQVTGVDGNRTFVQMLGVGFDAKVVCQLPFSLKKTFGKGAYVIQSLHEAFRYKFPQINIRIDGVETDAASVIVTKGCLYGGRFRLVSDASPSKPGFSVVLFDWSGLGAVLLYGMALPINLLGRAPGVRRVRAHRIDFLSQQAVPAQADGDPMESAPLCVVDAPAPIDIVVG